ncbi:MAG TPA: TonB-dependent receptor [Opitutaceae bacterium]|nr:TonB-dependent receptor [Opitutaceae bacterium]
MTFPLTSFPRAFRRAASLGLLSIAPPAFSQVVVTTPSTAVGLPAVTVTGTREQALLSETPASVGTIQTAAIRDTGPMHPGQILGQVPGVAVAVTNGEGHTTAIRQPFTTSPVYLFLEDGIPVRATGFFNHNALYEVNIPMAGGLEVVRGPGTSLYGSDAIGGIVNILSKAPGVMPELLLSAEAGSFGVWRLMASGSSPFTENGAFRADLNLTHNDGWRNKTAYDRQSLNLRWDKTVDADTTLKAILGVSKIDQETGANSALVFSDYLNNPTKNNFPIAYRKVEALRFSFEYSRKFGDGMLSVIPYYRDNSMELFATFNLSSDPRIDNGENVSYGALVKWRQIFPMMRARLIGGLDFDYSPGSRQEDNVLVTRSGTGANTLYSAYTAGTRIYDYEVTFKSTSPYLHGEISPTSKLRLTGGLRYDTLGFDMTNRLGAGTVQASVLGANRFYGQIAADKTTYSRVSPKFGATYALARNTHLYASYNQGFRGPSEGQLYRAGNDTNATNALNKARITLGLKPIKAEQFELGLRGEIARWSYNVVAYDLVKRDDLVSQRDLATNVSTSVNAGKTQHKGIEVGFGGKFTDQLQIDTAFSYARHRYIDWVTATASFSGRQIESAPGIITSTRLTWRPLPAAMAQVEWTHLGSYWLEAGNSPAFGKYPGHNLFNLRTSFAITKNFSVIGRVINVLDKRFADSASVSSNTPVFSPGLPRGFYGGIETRW